MDGRSCKDGGDDGRERCALGEAKASVKWALRVDNASKVPQCL